MITCTCRVILMTATYPIPYASSLLRINLMALTNLQCLIETKLAHELPKTQKACNLRLLPVVMLGRSCNYNIDVISIALISSFTPRVSFLPSNVHTTFVIDIALYVYHISHERDEQLLQTKGIHHRAFANMKKLTCCVYLMPT